MILGFREFYPWDKARPTNFREKIETCAIIQRLKSEKPDRVTFPLPEGSPAQTVTLDGRQRLVPYHPKIHTIRAGSRWMAGMKIQMAYGTRTKDYHQFNRDIPELEICRSVQTFEIALSVSETPLWTSYIDGKATKDIIPTLAKNDGFDSVLDFLKWFPEKPFQGQIVHWTDFRY